MLWRILFYTLHTQRIGCVFYPSLAGCLKTFEIVISNDGEKSLVQV